MPQNVMHDPHYLNTSRLMSFISYLDFWDAQSDIGEQIEDRKFAVCIYTQCVYTPMIQL